MRRALAWWSRLGLSIQILIGLALGVALGLFLGEPAGALEPLSDLYIRLMQMTVVPYLVLALIVGLGQLDAGNARTLALRTGALLLLFWGVAILVLSAMPLTFPPYESASFFSHTLLEPERPFSLAEMYVPSNPFHSLANSVIPAVVLFSGAIGVGLIGVPGKEPVLEALRVLNEAISRVTTFVISLTPIGVFAIGAVTAGTMSVDTLAQLEIYLIAFGVASLLLTFGLLPLLVTALTRFSYREVVGVARDALLTAFVASNVFIVLPILIERAKELFARHGMLDEESESAIDVIVPVFFNFPNAGKMLTLLFVPFGAWLAGSPLEAGQYPQLFVAGIPSYFAKAQIALPFLMDLMEVPHDLFQLYIPTTIVTGKLDSLVTATNLLVFALLGGAAMSGGLQIRPARLARAALASVAALALAVVGTSLLMRAFQPEYTKDRDLLSMDLAPAPVEKVVHEALPEESAPDSGLSALERIRKRGTLRVGYATGLMPFSFFNERDELVGYDIQLAGSLASALGVGLEFYPAALGDVPALVEAGVVDVQMTAAYTKDRLGKLRLSSPHIEGTLSFVVRDDRRHDFTSFAALRVQDKLTIGRIGNATFGEDELRRRAAPTRLEFVHFDSVSEFFDGSRPELDGLFVAAEIGSAWSLLHPAFAVVVPRPDPMRIPAGVALPQGEMELADFVEAWLVIERSSGRLQRAYDYWVLGRGAVQEKRRWSVLRDVLGWGSPEAQEPSAPSGESRIPPASSAPIRDGS